MKNNKYTRPKQFNGNLIINSYVLAVRLGIRLEYKNIHGANCTQNVINIAINVRNLQRLLTCDREGCISRRNCSFMSLTRGNNLMSVYHLNLWSDPFINTYIPTCYSYDAHAAINTAELSALRLSMNLNFRNRLIIYECNVAYLYSWRVRNIFISVELWG